MLTEDLDLSYVMAYNSIPWKGAVSSDPRYKHFLENAGHFWPIDRMQAGPRQLMYEILQSQPEKRIKLDAVFKDTWFKSIAACCSTNTPEQVGHKHCSEKPV